MHSHDTRIFDDNGPMNIITKVGRKKGGVNKILMMQALQWGL
jgi:hypothetical protein